VTINAVAVTMQLSGGQLSPIFINEVLVAGAGSYLYTEQGTATTEPNLIPDQFTFIDQSNVPLSTRAISAPITISGLTDGFSTLASISGAATSEYRINGGAWITADASVNNGNTIEVSHTSSALGTTATSTTLALGPLGQVTDTFTSTTTAAVGSGPFDFSAIPWHNGSGGWGAQRVLVSPTLPTTNRSVNCATASSFNTEAAVDGTEITITGDWTTAVTITANDIDVILPVGRSIGAIEMGSFTQSENQQRIRIRGTVPGQHSGGRMGQFRDIRELNAEDVTIDGIDMNGAASFGTGESNQAFRVNTTRLAVLNTRAIAPGYCWLGNATDVVIHNSNFFGGGDDRTTVGFVEGWCLRNTAGPVTIRNSRMESTRYTVVRLQSLGNAGELFYMGDGSQLVGVHEDRGFWLWDNLGNAPLGSGQGAIVENCEIYLYGAASCVVAVGNHIQASDCDYSRIRNNNFYWYSGNELTQAIIDTEEAGADPAGDHDWGVGNTFSEYTSHPAYGGPGDPTAVPLPSGFTVQPEGEGTCLWPY
jgi:hypothetical protein